MFWAPDQRSQHDKNDPLPPFSEGGGGKGPRSGKTADMRSAYSCSWRFSDSTSSDSAVSLATSASILRTACSTVV